jgi:peptidoglycan hydrolase-like protein with peptidoglycan-binding domain
MGGDVPLAALVKLLFTAGIIPAEKQPRACKALREIAESGQRPMAAGRGAPFTLPLALGDRSAEVRRLQQFLNTHGFALAPDGLGAPGKETDLFGILTFEAVKRFQAAYAADILTPVGLTSPSGFFGPSSIRKANALLAQ